MKKLILLLLQLIILTFPAAAAQSEQSLLVVMNNNVDVESLSQKQVMSLFLGRAKFLPSGEKVRAVDFPLNSLTRADFYQALTGKNIADIDAYWARLSYSGRATPPQEMPGSEEIIRLVSQQEAVIAYLPANYKSQLEDAGLKTVLTMRLN